MTAWAISSLQIIERKLCLFPKHDQELAGFIKEWFSMEEGSSQEHYRKEASLVIGFYLRSPWTDEELAELVANEVKNSRWKNGIRILEALGELGRTQLEELEKEKQVSR